MRNHNSPFLSAAVLRRILTMHPFSEANRAYLMEEASRRENWESEVKSLLESVPTLPYPPEPRRVREVDAARPLHAAPPY